MRTDDRETMDGRAEDGAENVVRLPREWVGPPEELVPMGSRARAREAGETVPGADDFWGEGAAAVHGAIQPPAHAVDTAGTAVRPRRVPRGRRPARRPWGFSVRRPAPRMPARRVWRKPAAIGVVALSLVIVAVIGLVEGGGGRPSVASRGASVALSRAGDPRQLGPAAGGLPHSALAGPNRASGSERKSSGRESTAKRARHQRLVREQAARKHRREKRERHSMIGTTSSQAASTPAPTETTVASPPPTTTAPAATSAGSSGSSSTHTSTHHSAFGQTGLLGAGHSSGDS